VECPAADGLPLSKFHPRTTNEQLSRREEQLSHSQSFLDKSIGEWRRRRDAIVQQNGGHIEHMFK